MIEVCYCVDVKSDCNKCKKSQEAHKAMRPLQMWPRTVENKEIRSNRQESEQNMGTWTGGFACCFVEVKTTQKEQTVLFLISVDFLVFVCHSHDSCFIGVKLNVGPFLYLLGFCFKKWILPVVSKGIRATNLKQNILDLTSGRSEDGNFWAAFCPCAAASRAFLKRCLCEVLWRFPALLFHVICL